MTRLYDAIMGHIGNIGIGYIKLAPGSLYTYVLYEFVWTWIDVYHEIISRNTEIK